jgi:hypothetical protein
MKSLYVCLCVYEEDGGVETAIQNTPSRDILKNGSPKRGSCCRGHQRSPKSHAFQGFSQDIFFCLSKDCGIPKIRRPLAMTHANQQERTNGGASCLFGRTLPLFSRESKSDRMSYHSFVVAWLLLGVIRRHDGATTSCVCVCVCFLDLLHRYTHTPSLCGVFGCEKIWTSHY